MEYKTLVELAAGQTEKPILHEATLRYYASGKEEPVLVAEKHGGVWFSTQESFDIWKAKFLQVVKDRPTRRGNKPGSHRRTKKRSKVKKV